MTDAARIAPRRNPISRAIALSPEIANDRAASHLFLGRQVGDDLKREYRDEQFGRDAVVEKYPAHFYRRKVNRSNMTVAAREPSR